MTLTEVLTGPDGRGDSTEPAVDPAADAIIGRVGALDANVESSPNTQASRRLESRFRAAQSLVGLAWWELDIVTGVPYWSDSMLRLVGRDPADGPPNEEDFALLLPSDLRQYYHKLLCSEDVGEPDIDLFTIRRVDGRDRIVQAWHDIERDDAGRPLRWFVVAMDVTEREEIARRHIESERRLADAQELAGLAWWEWDVGTGQLQWSAGMRRLAGVGPDETPSAAQWLELVHPRDAEMSDQLERRALQEGIPYTHVFRLRRPDGTWRILRSTTGPNFDAGGAIVGLRGATMDVTAEELGRRDLAASEEQFRVAFEQAPNGMLLIDTATDRLGRVLRANAAMGLMLGLAQDHILALEPLGWALPEDRDGELTGLADLLNGRHSLISGEKRFLHRDGHVLPVWVTIAPVRSSGREPRYLVMHVLDLTEQQAQRAELSRLALTDTLTGLANRTLVQNRTEHALRRLERTPGMVGLLLIDLDGFKRCNDSLGHQQGDSLLVEVAARLTATTRPDTTVGRLGGDEFVVVLERIAETSEAVVVAERILRALRKPYRLAGGTELSVTGSIGIAVTDRASTPQTDLMRDADLALYAAKDAGRDRAARFDDAMRVRVDRQLAAELSVRRALSQDELRLVCQPIIEMSSGRVVSSEALLRVADAAGSLSLPEQFIEIAELTGLIPELDLQMLYLAGLGIVGDQRVQTADGASHALRRIAVNMSGVTLGSSSFPSRFEAVTAALELSAQRLAVEITESTLLAPSPQVARSLAYLKECGARLGLDDFGTGWSALSYLQRFDLDFLKVDRSFVARLGTSKKSDALVRAIIDLAHAIGLQVTAEGVETDEQHYALRAMGCDHGQGYLYGRPVPLVEHEMMSAPIAAWDVPRRGSAGRPAEL